MILGFGQTLHRATGLRLYAQQYHAMLVKRVLHTFRNKLVTLAQLFVPLFFAIAALIIVKTLPHSEDSPPLILNTDCFDYNVVAYGTNANSSKTTKMLAGNYSEIFHDPNTALHRVKNDKHPSVEDYLIYQGNRSLPRYTNHFDIAAEFSDEKKEKFQTRATAFFNGQAYHSAPISLGAITNTILRFLLGINHSIVSVNHPIPRDVEDEINDKLRELYMGFTLSFNILFGMAFLASSFVVFLIRERAIKAKHCQIVSGVKWSTFWFATFTWDLVNYLLPCVLLIVVFAAFGVDAYVDDGRFADIFLLLLLYGWAILPFMYILSFIFTVPSTGLVWLTMFNILSGKDY